MRQPLRLSHRFTKAVCAMGLAVVIAGCGTQPLTLKPVDANQPAVRLNEPFEYTGKHFTHLWGSRLAAGDYRPIGKDARGIFYVGPALCYSHRVVKEGPLAGADSRNFVMVADCGLYLPTSSNAPIRVLVLSGSARSIPLDSPDQAQAKIEALSGAAAQVLPAPDAPPDSTGLLVNTMSMPPPAGNYIQAGMGAGIGMGLVGAMVAAEYGRLNDAVIQPQGDGLREALLGGASEKQKESVE